MARKKNKLAEILHIKERTEGTSNEISFSVLDARSKQADSGRDKKHQFWGDTSGRSATNASSETKRNVSRETTSVPYDPEREIARRKRNRRLRRVLSGVVGTLLLVAVAAGAGWYLYKDYRVQEDTRGLLNDSVALIAQTDDEVLDMDELLKESVNKETIQRMESLQDKIPDAQEKLRRAKQEASSIVDAFHSGKDREAAGQTINAATARDSMFEQGSSIMEESVKTYEIASQLEESWNLVLSADTLTRNAAGLVSQTTNENVQQASQLTNDAIAQLNEASAMFHAIEGKNYDIDLQPYLDYIAVKLESLGYALASNDAILLQDRKTAEDNNRLYNEKDAEAVQLAALLPESPTAELYDRYDDTTAGLFDAYNSARETASAADSFLRDYLGTVEE